jgi:hypothetical protein
MDISELKGINATDTLSLAYSFTGLMFIDRFKIQGIDNYFRTRKFDLPKYQILEAKDIKFAGSIPVNQAIGEFTWDTLKLDIFLSSDYFEYKYFVEWMNEIREHREYLHSWTNDDGTKLVTNLTMFILNSKEEKVSMGLRFTNAFPIALNPLTYEKKVSPLLLNMEFKFANIERIPDQMYSNIIL